MVFSFPRYSLDVAWTWWIVLFELVPRLSASGFSPTLSTLRNHCIWILWYTTQLWYTIYNSHSILVVAVSFFWEVFFFFCFFWLFINRVMRKQTLVSSLRTRFTFYRIGIRADANIHNAFACRYLSNNICTVVEEWTHGNFCLGYFSSSTHNDLVIRLAQRVWRQCVLVFVHDLGVVTETASVSLQTLAFFSTSNRYEFLLQRRLIPFDSWPLVLIQFSHACMASKFRNRSFWSILLFTIIFNFW